MEQKVRGLVAQKRWTELKEFLKSDVINNTVLSKLFMIAIQTSCPVDVVQQITLKMEQDKLCGVLQSQQPHPSCIVRAANQDNDQVLKLLVKCGASLNEQHCTGGEHDLCHIPLMCAVLHGMTNAVENLVNAGASINCRTGKSCKIRQKKLYACGYSTLLHIAVQKSDTYVIDYLIAKGIDINVTDDRGMTPLHVACLHGYNSVAQYLIRMYSPDTCIPDNYCNCINYSIQDKYDATVLYYAVRSCCTDVVEDMLKYSRLQQKPEYEAQLLVHLALRNRKYACSLLQTLVEYGYTVNNVDNDHESTLHKAIHTGDISVVSTLLELGAHCNVFDNHGATPLMLAAKQGSVEMCLVLLYSGADPNLTSPGESVETALFYAYFSLYDDKNSDIKGYIMSCMKLLLFEGTKLSATDYSSNMLFMSEELNYWLAFFGTLPQNAINSNHATRVQNESRDIDYTEPLELLTHNPFSLQHICRLAICCHVQKSVKHSRELLCHAVVRFCRLSGQPTKFVKYLLYLQLHPLLSPDIDKSLVFDPYSKSHLSHLDMYKNVAEELLDDYGS